jgi:hypothetical protein
MHHRVIAPSLVGAALGTLLWYWVGTITTVHAAPEPLLVIVGLKFPAKNLKLADLKTLFRGEATYLGDKRLVPINHEVNTADRMSFDRVVLGLEPQAVGRFWVDKRIRDEGSPPKAVAPELAVRIVAALPNAVTYGTKAALNPKVMALSLDDKHAGQPGYPLAQ